jgi:hypothetical protein
MVRQLLDSGDEVRRNPRFRVRLWGSVCHFPGTWSSKAGGKPTAALPNIYVHFAKTASLIAGVEVFARVVTIVTKVCYKRWVTGLLPRELVLGLLLQLRKEKELIPPREFRMRLGIDQTFRLQQALCCGF